MGKCGTDKLLPTPPSKIITMVRIKSHTDSLPPITFSIVGGIEGGSVVLFIFLKIWAQYFFPGVCFCIKHNSILQVKLLQYGHEVTTGLPANVILSM